MLNVALHDDSQFVQPYASAASKSRWAILDAKLMQCSIAPGFTELRQRIYLSEGCSKGPCQKTGNVTKSPLKQARKENNFAPKLYEHAITYYRVQVRSALASSID